MKYPKILKIRFKNNEVKFINHRLSDSVLDSLHRDFKSHLSEIQNIKDYVAFIKTHIPEFDYDEIKNLTDFKEVVLD